MFLTQLNHTLKNNKDGKFYGVYVCHNLFGKVMTNYFMLCVVFRISHEGNMLKTKQENESLRRWFNLLRFKNYS